MDYGRHVTGAALRAVDDDTLAPICAPRSLPRTLSAPGPKACDGPRCGRGTPHRTVPSQGVELPPLVGAGTGRPLADSGVVGRGAVCDVRAPAVADVDEPVVGAARVDELPPLVVAACPATGRAGCPGRSRRGRREPCRCGGRRGGRSRRRWAGTATAGWWRSTRCTGCSSRRRRPGDPARCGAAGARGQEKVQVSELTLALPPSSWSTAAPWVVEPATPMCRPLPMPTSM